MALLQITEPAKSQDPHKKKYYIGIDLGTTNSLVALVINGSPTVLKGNNSEELFPSIVSYKENEIIVGDIIKDDKSITFRSIKRLIGKNINDFNSKNFYSPCEYTGDDQVIKFNVFKKLITPVEISSEILKYLKRIAEESLLGEIAGCVITVPAYFDDAQRQATKDAAAISNIKVLRLLNEPTAAAIAYGLERKKISKVMVYDLGGGTFDVSILDLSDGVFKVRATGGDSSLGGDDFDNLLADYIEDKCGLKLNAKKKYELYLYVKKIKILLSKHDNVLVELKDIGIPDIKLSISVEEFNLIIKKLVDKTIQISRNVLDDANLLISEINEIILVGGSTRTPYVKNMVQDFFKKEPLSNINPDNVVAIGAAIQANILSGMSTDELLLLDVIPLSLGIETMGGLSEVIIPRNSTIPTSRNKEYTTFKDGQNAMSIHVVQGERDLVTDCRSLAKFVVKDIPPMLAGLARINVEFQVDADGILSVSAREASTNKVTSIEVKPSYGISDSEIEEMLKDSFDNAEEDISVRQLNESIVDGKRVILAINSALNIDGKELLSDKEFKIIISARDKLQNTLGGKHKDIIKAIKDLEKCCEPYVSKRMNSNIQKIMKGKDIKEYNKDA